MVNSLSTMFEYSFLNDMRTKLFRSYLPPNRFVAVQNISPSV